MFQRLDRRQTGDPSPSLPSRCHQQPPGPEQNHSFRCLQLRGQTSRVLVMQFGLIGSSASQDSQISWGLPERSSSGSCAPGMPCSCRWIGFNSVLSGFGRPKAGHGLGWLNFAGENTSASDKELNFKSYPFTLK